MQLFICFTPSMTLITFPLFLFMTEKEKPSSLHSQQLSSTACSPRTVLVFTLSPTTSPPSPGWRPCSRAVYVQCKATATRAAIRSGTANPVADSWLRHELSTSFVYGKSLMKSHSLIFVAVRPGHPIAMVRRGKSLGLFLSPVSQILPPREFLWECRYFSCHSCDFLHQERKGFWQPDLLVCQQIQMEPQDKMANMYY